MLIKLPLCCLLLSVALYTASAQVTSGSSYRLSNVLQGACRSLSEPGGSSTEPQMAKTDHVSSQLWTFTAHPSKPGLYRITSSSGRALTMVPGANSDLDAEPSKGVTGGSGGKTTLAPEPEGRWKRAFPPKSNNGPFSTSPNIYNASKLILANVGTAPGGDENLQYWRLKAVNEYEGHYRIVNARDTKTDTDKSIGSRDASGTKVEALEDVAYLGTQWWIDPAETVSGVPGSLRLNSFYRKYISMDGIPIVSSHAVPDKALYRAYFTVRHMLSKSKLVRNKMVQYRAKLAVMGQREQTTHIPEHRHLGASWNARARGLGGTVHIPTASCAEENLMCYRSDRYSVEDITIHEFAHSVHNLGLHFADSRFESTLSGLYRSAMAAGKYRSTYAATNAVEYFAEAVQSWLNVNAEASPPNGIHNHVNTREELKVYDPGMYALLTKWMPADHNKCSCH